MVDTVMLPVKIRIFLFDADFVVLRSVAALFILGADFCDRLVKANCPRSKLVDLDDGCTVPIVRLPMKRSPASTLFSSEKGYERTQQRVTTDVETTKTANISGNTEQWISVFLRGRSSVVIHSETKLLERDSVICSSGIAQVEPEVPVRILMAIFSIIPRKSVKGQVVATVLPHPAQAVLLTVTVADVLCFADAGRAPKKSMNSNTHLKDQICLRQLLRIYHLRWMTMIYRIYRRNGSLL